MSLTGPETLAWKRLSWSSVSMTSALAVKVLLGASVVMLTTPADAALPNRVLWGPRSTSTCWTSTRAAKAAAWKAWGTSSMTTATLGWVAIEKA